LAQSEEGPPWLSWRRRRAFLPPFLEEKGIAPNQDIKGWRYPEFQSKTSRIYAQNSMQNAYKVALRQALQEETKKYPCGTIQ
jgi:hypothetical protein